MLATLSFKDVLRRADASRIGPGEFLFKEISSRTIQQVLTTLSVAHIQEIPVFNHATYVVFGLYDLLPCLLEIASKVEDQPYPFDLSVVTSLKREVTQQVKLSIASFLETRTANSTFVSLDFSQPLYEAVNEIITRKLSQISITTDKDVLLNIINVDTVVRYIYVNRQRLRAKYFSATVGQLKMGKDSKVFTIKEDDKALEAFKIINREKILAVAVVNNTDELVGCINLNDIHVIFKPKRNISDLFLPAHKFIETGMLLSKGVVPPPYSVYGTCSENTTLWQLVDMMVRNRVRNVFCIDDQHKVTGMITARDIVATFTTMSSK